MRALLGPAATSQAATPALRGERARQGVWGVCEQGSWKGVEGELEATRTRRAHRLDGGRARSAEERTTGCRVVVRERAKITVWPQSNLIARTFL